MKVKFSNDRFGFKGTLDKSTGVITVQSGQVAVNNDAKGLHAVIYVRDDATDNPETDVDIKYYLDPEDGSISLDDNTTVGLYDTRNLSAYGLITTFRNCGYGPASLLPEKKTWSYSCIDKSGNKLESDVDVIQVDDETFFVKGLMPKYPDAWLAGIKSEEFGNALVFLSYQVLTDNVAMRAATFSSSYPMAIDYCGLEYNADKNNYFTDDKTGLVDNLYSKNDENIVNTVAYKSLSLTSPASGIDNAVDDKSNGKIISTNLYDLYGCKLNGTSTNGVKVKVVKYADGTSKAIKVMK